MVKIGAVKATFYFKGKGIFCGTVSMQFGKCRNVHTRLLTL